MADEQEEERFCLICSKKLSNLNPRDICFCHKVMPGSPQDIKLKQMRLQAMQEKNKKQAIYKVAFSYC